jgi:hypothetical protein
LQSQNSTAGYHVKIVHASLLEELSGQKSTFAMFCNAGTKAKADRLLFKWIELKQRPPFILEDKELRDVFAVFGYKPFSRPLHRLMRTVAHSDVEDLLHKELQLEIAIGLAADEWSSRKLEGHCGVLEAHITANFEYVVNLLRCSKIEGLFEFATTCQCDNRLAVFDAAGIKDYLDQTREAFEITSKRTTLTTDNASVMETVRTSYDEKEDKPDYDDNTGCYAHTFQLILKVAFRDSIG